MASRVKIEEQIRLLNEQLVAFTAYDPEFTPKELVRWNPDLIGMVLHCEHTPQPLNMKDLLPSLLPASVEIFSIITGSGMLKNTPVPKYYKSTIKGMTYNEEIFNDFKEMVIYIRTIHLGLPSFIPEFKQNLKKLNVTAVIEDEHFLGSTTNTMTIALALTDINILNNIYVSSIITLPHSENPQIVHKYPLSHLYKKWKQEKDARTPAEPEDPRTKP